VILSRPHAVTVGGGNLREVEIPLQPEPGRMVRRVHAKLSSALGPITIESDPPGADVSFDGRPAGRTPVTIGSVRLDERHRVDLTLAGHEIDQFVVLPQDDGQRFSRKLAPAGRRRAQRQGTGGP
jgi:hypothetical protein